MHELLTTKCSWIYILCYTNLISITIFIVVVKLWLSVFLKLADRISEDQVLTWTSFTFIWSSRQLLYAWDQQGDCFMGCCDVKAKQGISWLLNWKSQREHSAFIVNINKFCSMKMKRFVIKCDTLPCFASSCFIMCDQKGNICFLLLPILIESGLQNVLLEY